MRRRTIYVVLNGYSSLVSGYGSRAMIEVVTGRAPVWSNLRRGWCVQEATARNVLAVAERDNCDTVITDARVAQGAVPHEKTSLPIHEQSDPGRGLW